MRVSEERVGGDQAGPKIDVDEHAEVAGGSRSTWLGSNPEGSDDDSGRPQGRR